MKNFRTVLSLFLAIALFIFANPAQSAPHPITEINEAVLASPMLQKYCHPALNELCFWQPEVFLLGYSKKAGLMATIQLTPENNESGSTVYQLSINKRKSILKKYGKRYEFHEDQPLPSSIPNGAFSDIEVFWKAKRVQIIKTLNQYAPYWKPVKEYSFTTKNSHLLASSAKTINSFVKSYDCKSCSMPIIADAVVGYLQIEQDNFAVVCFLEKGITGGPAVAHIELVGL